jgi:hypothetical protein
MRRDAASPLRVLAVAARLWRPHRVLPCVFGDGWCRHLSARLSRDRRLIPTANGQRSINRVVKHSAPLLGARGAA